MTARSLRMCSASASIWLVAAISSIFPAASARADGPATSDSPAVILSEQRAAEAYEAYTKKDYAGAVMLYLQAYEAAPNGSILYNIARIYDTKLADRQLAITFYRRYIANPGTYTERIELANQRLKELREADSLSKTIASEEAALPQAGARLAPGERQQQERHRQRTQRGESGWSALRSTGAVTGAAGLAALSVGVAFAFSAMSKADTAHQLCDGNACTSQRGVDAANAAESAATISNIGFAAGGGLLATGVALFLLGGDEPTEGSQSGGVGWTPRASTSALALEVSGKW